MSDASLKRQGHYLLERILRLRSTNKRKRLKQGKREQIYSQIGGHFSKLSGEKLRQAVAYLRRVDEAYSDLQAKPLSERA